MARLEGGFIWKDLAGERHVDIDAVFPFLRGEFDSLLHGKSLAEKVDWLMELREETAQGERFDNLARTEWNTHAVEFLFEPNNSQEYMQALIEILRVAGVELSDIGYVRGYFITQLTERLKVDDYTAEMLDQMFERAVDAVYGQK